MTIGPDVVVVRTGTANLASVMAGLKRAGASPRIGESRQDVERASRLVLPGVGTLAAAMNKIRENGLVEPLSKRICIGRSTLAVCLCMQMLCETSEESPGLKGLGVVKGHIARYPKGLAVPQLGWNNIEAGPGARLLKQGYAYFANSYCLRQAPDGWTAAMADYGGSFVAGMERGAVLACQFHPELSSSFGLNLIRRWLYMGEEIGEPSC
jgi:imidazole glycerol phosphate synthase glutamine amidotransferase subunit